jgi:hypothetical protein
MKTKRFLVFGLPLLLALSLAVCDTGDGTGTETDTNNTGGNAPVLSVLGSFGNGGHIKLQSSSGTSSASVMRSVAAEDDISYPLEGVLEYDNVLVRLWGSYEPDSGNWSVSARYGEGDSEAVYTIDGIVDSKGDLRGAGATIVMPDEDNEGEWLPAFFPVEIGAWSPSGEAHDSVTEGGMPPEMHGYWNAAWDMPILSDGNVIHMTMQCLISDWKITATGRRVSMYEDRVIKQNQNIVEIVPVEEGDDAGAIDVISCYLEYPEDTANLKTALTEWLELADDDITVWEDGEEPNGPWIKDNMGMPYPETGGFSAEQWEEVQSFYAANGWEIWVANNAEVWNEDHPNGPIVQYAKYRFLSDGDNLNMTKIVWGDEPWAPDTYYDLESVYEYGLNKEHKWLLFDGEYEDEGVLTVPYSRTR